jgi:glycosyltransferase involved in cell wall biosynthesis
VAFFAPWIGPLLVAHPTVSAGGAETQILMVVQGLARRGTHTCLVVFEIDEPLPDDYEGTRVITVRTPRSRSRVLRAITRAARVSRTLLRLRAPIYVQRIAGPETGLVALLAKLRGARFVYSSANVVDFDYGQLGTGRLKVWLFHLGVRLADTIVVQTPEQVGLCRERFGREPVMIKSVAEPAPLRTEKPDAFLWVGRADWYKRPEAFLELARAVPEARFRMVAMPMDEPGHDRLRQLEQECRELPNLELLPPRPRSELAALIPSSVAMVNTSDYEGMPNVFLEGWARGVPALALTHDPDGAIEREQVGAFAHGSPERFAALARELWHKRDDQSELAARCRAYVESEHSPDAVIGRWVAALGLG